MRSIVRETAAFGGLLRTRVFFAARFQTLMVRVRHAQQAER
jgi:hypothetical protein